MKHLEILAEEYAQKNFPIHDGCNNGNNAIKHDVAYHSFADGFNEAMRILENNGNEHLSEENSLQRGDGRYQEETQGDG